MDKMDTKIEQKLRLAQLLIDILKDGIRKDKAFVISCGHQLLQTRNELCGDLAIFREEQHQHIYHHIAAMIDNATESISQTGDDIPN